MFTKSNVIIVTGSVKQHEAQIIYIYIYIYIYHSFDITLDSTQIDLGFAIRRSQINFI
jgi:hypothetical protein